MNKNKPTDSVLIFLVTLIVTFIVFMGHNYGVLETDNITEENTTEKNLTIFEEYVNGSTTKEVYYNNLGFSNLEEEFKNE